jgi:hypothetical protein
MEVDGAKHVHVVWSDFSVTPDANYKSFYSHLNNGGSSFITPIDLSTLFVAGNNVLMPVVSTAGNQVSIGAYVIDASKVSDYYIINSQDNGNTWSAPIKVSSVSTDFASASNTGAWFGDYANAVRTDTKVYTIWSDGRSAGGPKMYVNTTTLWATPTTDITPINSSLQLNDLYHNPVNSGSRIINRWKRNTDTTPYLVSRKTSCDTASNRSSNRQLCYTNNQSRWFRHRATFRQEVESRLTTLLLTSLKFREVHPRF